MTRLALLLLGLSLPTLAWGVEGAVEAVPSLGQALEATVASTPGDEVSTAVRLVVMMTALSMLPAVLLLMTPFTRFVIVLSLLRQALGLQQSPPNQVLVALALMLSLVAMQNTVSQVDAQAVQPYLAGDLETAAAYEAGIGPLRTFMLRNTRRDDLAASMRIARLHRPESLEDLPTTVVITAFVLSELGTAFTIAVKVYLPFLVVDLVVASVLLGMGMMMLPPVVVSLPFKLMVFVLMDGWTLLITGMMGGIH